MPQATDNRDQAALAAALLDEIRSLLDELQPGRASAVEIDADLDKDLGIDSLGRVELVVRLEQRFDTRLPGDVFAEADTPRDLLQAILASSDVAAAPAPPPVADNLAESPAAPLPEQASTLPEVLRWHADRSPERIHIRLLANGVEQRTLSHRELLTAAETMAVGLQARGLQPGERVALMLPTGIDYFVSFFAIQLCGGVPVPIYPPARASQLAEHLQRHAGILANCGAVFLVTIARARPLGHLLQARVRSLRGILVAADIGTGDNRLLPPVLHGDATAFLQYTSGSTGSPKGVVLSHADLLASIRAMGRAIEANADDVFVSWLPLYHDMGLIGAWFGSLYYGIPLVIMSPLDFLARPLTWLETIARYRGTLSAAPNFGYELCMNRIGERQLRDLDLGSWRAAFNGAEPVSPATLQRFIQRFAPAGFRAEASMPVYGLAEATLGLTFPPLGREPLIDRVDRRLLSEQGRAQSSSDDDDSVLRFASCGRVLDGYRVRIVDDDGNELAERRQGRIQFQGPSATRGYFENPQATAELFDGDWLDSGDLGYLADGELFVTGRRKDLIVRAGRNLYPQELEDAIGDIDGIRKGCVAAFGSVDPADGTERLVVIAETTIRDHRQQEQIRHSIRRLSAERVGAAPEIIELLPPHSVLKTSSGKIRRSANREAFEQGTLQQPRAGPGVARLLLSGLPGLLRSASRRLGDHLYAAWSLAIFWLLAPLAWLGVAALPRRRWRFALARFLGRALARLTATPFVVDQAQALPPREQACILVCNHASYLDGALLVAALPRELTFVAKEALGPQWVAGTFLRRLGAVFVERFDPRRGLADLQRIAELAQSGDAVVFFAEGTFSAAPGLRPFHMGAFVTALESQLPVVPVAISGTRRILRANSWHPQHGRVRITLGDPIAPPALSDAPGENWRAAVALRDRTREWILAHCGEADAGQPRW